MGVEPWDRRDHHSHRISRTSARVASRAPGRGVAPQRPKGPGRTGRRHVGTARLYLAAVIQLASQQVVTGTVCGVLIRRPDRHWSPIALRHPDDFLLNGRRLWGWLLFDHHDAMAGGGS